MSSTTIPDSVRVNATDKLPFGLLAFVGAGLSVAFCFAKTIVLSVLPLIGLAVVEFEFNPHAQAALMSLFALVGAVGLGLDKTRCGSTVPFALGLASLLIIAGTLYGYHADGILTMGYVALMAAAFLNLSFRLRRLNLEVTGQAAVVHNLNATLEQRVETQVQEIEKLGRLKRFLAPAVANLLVTEDEHSRLDSHRRYIATLFCDLRGFTSFTESAEPEDVMAILRAYHEQMGRLAAQYEATIDHRAGDGLMLFFNDPIPCDAPVLKAVQLALDMHAAFARLNEEWKKIGYQLGFGVGIASGYATMGIVGFEGRFDYTANGNAVNLAARLCDCAQDGEILISHRALVDVEGRLQAARVDDLSLKGIRAPVVAYRVLALVEAEQTA
jgi:class 3 adenylate cyclase